MTSSAELKKTSKRSSRNVTLSASLVMLLLSFGLMSCSSASSAPKALQSPILSQPPVLRLKAAVQIPTIDGAYTPASDEIWHSDARFTKSEQQATDAAAALVQERNRAK